MRSFFHVFVFTLITVNTIGQATYSAADFAAGGDTFYLTRAQPGNFNFDTTGAGITWNYATLTGASQKRVIFRLPAQTGFTFLQWPYIYNSSNVNLSATDEQTVAVLGLQQTNPNDYYFKSSVSLQQKASSYTIVLNGISFNVKNVYTSADTIYKFPFTYNSVNASEAAYTIAIPGLYYRNVQLSRKDTIQGWGTINTPYGSFTNCLKYVSAVTQIDSIAVYGTPVITNDTTMYREIKWFDPLKKFPLILVKQNKTGNGYITQSIEYFDNRQYYQPAALFAYVPLAPDMKDTVNFQNLSTNGYAYKWYFNDPQSGAGDSSTETNPQHIFNNPGTYTVQLIAFNGNLSDTFYLAVVVSPVNITYTFTGNGNWSDSANWSNNAIPPATLPATNAIFINPVAGGKCILNSAQHIAAGASLTVNPGKNLVVQGALRIE